MITPEYCHSVAPLYALAVSTCALAGYYTRLTVRDSGKQFASIYSTGALLFFLLGVGVLMRAVRTSTKGQDLVDEIYSDIYNSSQDMTAPEKTRLSAMISQVKYGDAPVSLYSTISRWSQTITGFGYSGTESDGRSSSNWKQWSEMRGLPKSNATEQLIHFTCQVFRRINAPSSLT
ncbi:hypothetical protein BV898_19202 [Hypsibius exemplaris]|uniref:Uncharacterized protein n=1 Tax=Hypsibius exemplaris TaxID=2072580 RepID=A0A9X6NL14_HYPEX|nr:hypothetical protein BV898_19202 [Hypsibius exemplaris]